MSTTLDKLRGLVESLYARTEEGKLDWSLSSDQTGVWSDVGGYKIEISEESTDGFEQSIRTTVFNDAGDQVDTFSDSYFRGVHPVRVNLTSYYSLMGTLLEMARRQASGADAAIETLLNTLGGTPVDVPPKRRGFADDLDDDVPF